MFGWIFNFLRTHNLFCWLKDHQVRSCVRPWIVKSNILRLRWSGWIDSHKTFSSLLVKMSNPGQNRSRTRLVPTPSWLDHVFLGYNTLWRMTLLLLFFLPWYLLLSLFLSQFTGVLWQPLILVQISTLFHHKWNERLAWQCVGRVVWIILVSPGEVTTLQLFVTHFRRTQTLFWVKSIQRRCAKKAFSLSHVV